MTRRAFSLALIVSLSIVVPALAQEPTEVQAIEEDQVAASPPAYLSVVDGEVALERDARTEQAIVNMPLLPGDRVATRAGRAEVRYPDGSLLHLDRYTRLDVLSDSLIRLHEGRLIFAVAGSGYQRPSLDYQVDAAAGSVQVLTPGEYRISSTGAAPSEVSLDVVSGRANLFTETGLVELQAGQRSLAREGYQPSYPVAFNSARLDAFDRWSEDRRSQLRGYASTRYLPSELDYYAGDFDRYGRWETVEPYGYVWYPTVSVGWRPYYHGYWHHLPIYGWTWIGYDRWSWATHHYGRWGFRAGVWFWVPSRRWAPAWVSWGFSAGYVSWCPLGWDNRPVVNIFLGSRYGHRGYYDPWHAWTVVPRHSFGHGIHVTRVAVRGAALPETVRASFAVQRNPPGAPAGFAVPRGGTRITAEQPRPRALPRGFENAGPRGAPAAIGANANRGAAAVRRGADGVTDAPSAGGAVRRGQPSLGSLAREPGSTPGGSGAIRRGDPGTSPSQPGARTGGSEPSSPGAVRRTPPAASSPATPGASSSRPSRGGSDARSSPGAVRRTPPPASSPATPGASSSRPSRGGSDAPSSPGAVRRTPPPASSPATPGASSSRPSRGGSDAPSSPGAVRRTPPPASSPATPGASSSRPSRGGSDAPSSPGAVRRTPPPASSPAPPGASSSRPSRGSSVAPSSPGAVRRTPPPSYGSSPYGRSAPSAAPRAGSRSPYSAPGSAPRATAPPTYRAPQYEAPRAAPGRPRGGDSGAGYARPRSSPAPSSGGRSMSVPSRSPSSGGRSGMSAPPSRGGSSGAVRRGGGSSGGGSQPSRRGGDSGGGGGAARRR